VLSVPLEDFVLIQARLVSRSRPVGIRFHYWQQGAQIHASPLVVELPAQVGHRDVRWKRGVTAESIKGGLVEVEDDGDQDMGPFEGRVIVNL
jgi:hypothetical protein